MTIARRVISYKPEYAADFARLNYQWIEHYFRIEPEDRAALDHPEEYAIKSGGEIFLVLADAGVIGAVALVPKAFKSDGVVDVFELAKMAVDPTFQGQGIGKELLARAVAYARERGARRIVLSTNDILAPALKVYTDAGFLVKAAPQDERYERSNLFMQLDL